MRARQPQTLTVSEGRPIRLPKEFDAPRLRDSMLRFSANTGISVFERTKNGVRAGNFVGLADLGFLQVQILPKISNSSTLEDDASFLSRLLLRSGIVPNASVRVARPGFEKGWFLDPILERFSSNLVKRIHADPPRRYHREQAQSSVLRGRPLLSRMATQVPGRDWLIPIEHHPLQRNNPLSQLVKAVAEELRALTGSIYARRNFSEVLDVLADVEKRDLARALEGFSLGPYEAHWKDLENVARALLTGAAPSILAVGEEKFFGLLFSLYDLFEALIRRTLTEAKLDDWRVRKERRKHLLSRANDDGSVERMALLKPDYLICRLSGEPVCVADAKWKLLSLGQKGLGLSQDDVYQICTYMMGYGTKRGILFFPHFGPTNGGVSVLAQRWAISGASSELTIMSVDVSSLVSDVASERLAVRENLYAEISKVCAAD